VSSIQRQTRWIARREQQARIACDHFSRDIRIPNGQPNSRLARRRSHQPDTVGLCEEQFEESPDGAVRLLSLRKPACGQIAPGPRPGCHCAVVRSRMWPDQRQAASEVDDALASGRMAASSKSKDDDRSESSESGIWILSVRPKSIAAPMRSNASMPSSRLSRLAGHGEGLTLSAVP
jgi:hypothetical protein